MLETNLSRAVRDQRLIAGVVANLPLFRGTPRAQLEGLGQRCRVLQGRRGQMLVGRGGYLPGFIAVAYGTVKLTLGNSDGESRVLRLVSAGQSFGEASALLGRPSRYDATALCDCKLVVIPPEAVLALLDQAPRLARGIVASLAERTLEMLAEVESATVKCSAQRLAAYLQSLSGSPEPAGACTVRLPVSKTVVAARLGVKKETLSRLLRRFATDGLIAVSRRDIAILDRERVLQVANGAQQSRGR